MRPMVNVTMVRLTVIDNTGNDSDGCADGADYDGDYADAGDTMIQKMINMIT